MVFLSKKVFFLKKWLRAEIETRGAGAENFENQGAAAKKSRLQDNSETNMSQICNTYTIV